MSRPMFVTIILTVLGALGYMVGCAIKETNQAEERRAQSWKATTDLFGKSFTMNGVRYTVVKWSGWSGLWAMSATGQEINIDSQTAEYLIKQTESIKP